MSSHTITHRIEHDIVREALLLRASGQPVTSIAIANRLGMHPSEVNRYWYHAMLMVSSIVGAKHEHTVWL